jgi:hypothetical protein
MRYHAWYRHGLFSRWFLRTTSHERAVMLAHEIVTCWPTLLTSNNRANCLQVITSPTLLTGSNRARKKLILTLNFQVFNDRCSLWEIRLLLFYAWTRFSFNMLRYWFLHAIACSTARNNAMKASLIPSKHRALASTTSPSKSPNQHI